MRFGNCSAIGRGNGKLYAICQFSEEALLNNGCSKLSFNLQPNISSVSTYNKDIVGRCNGQPAGEQ
jgi:hypothetical protein